MVYLSIVPGDPNQRFRTSLAGTEYLVSLRWNARVNTWFMHLHDDQEDPIWLSMAVVLGVPIGSRCIDERWPGMLRAVDLSGTGRDAGLDDLGVRVMIEFYTEEEVAEILEAGA